MTEDDLRRLEAMLERHRGPTTRIILPEVSRLIRDYRRLRVHQICNLLKHERLPDTPERLGSMLGRWQCAIEDGNHELVAEAAREMFVMLRHLVVPKRPKIRT